MKLTRCDCKLKDCAFFHAVPGIPGLCDCSHNEKEFYMHNPCPLYRKNWAAATESDKASDLLNRFVKKKN